MRICQGLWSAVGFSLLVLAGWACQPQERVESPDQGAGERTTELAQLQDSLQEVRAEIDSVIGNAQANTLSQCRLLPLGSRPCGGPSSYVAYSTAVTDSSTLTDLAGIYRSLMERRNEETGAFSTCEMLSPPELVLEAGRCVGVRPPDS